MAYELILQERKLTGKDCHVAIMDENSPDLKSLYASAGIAVHPLHWKRHGYWQVYRNTLKLLRGTSFSNVLCYTLGSHVAVAAAARQCGIPCVLHIGTAPPVQTPKVVRIMKGQMWAGLPFVHRYVGCSEYVRDQLSNIYSIPKSWCVAIPNGIDLKRFEAVRALRGREQQGEPVLGMVASLESSKDHTTLLQAISILKQQNFGVRLRLIGAGSYTEHLKGVTTNLNIMDRVDWIGSSNDVPGELAKLSLFVYSAKPEEGLGIALVEALASGLPVVATDVNACKEVLREYKEAIMVPFQNAADMAEGIKQAIDRPACDMKILDRFSIESTARGYLNLVGR